MTRDDTIPPLYIHIFCIISYFTAVFINEFSVTEHLNLVNLSSIQYQQISSVKLFGRLIAAAILLSLIQRSTFKTIINYSLILYSICVFYIISSDAFHSMTLLYFAIYSASIMIISTILLGYILVDSTINNIYSISIYIISILTSYIISVCYEYFTISSTNDIFMLKIIASNIFPLGAFFITLMYSSSYKPKINLNEYRFFPVLKRMELEALLGFVIFYCVVEIQNGYSNYALANLLTIFNEVTRNSINIFALLTAIGLNIFYCSKIKKHQLSIASLFILNFTCLTMPNWSKYPLISAFGRVVLITTLYTIFMCSILMLVEKFKGINLFNAIAIYVFCAASGYYCGYVTIATSEETIGSNGLLISICFVLIGLLLYYLYFFKKHKLYR
ncbi:MAG: hypothetical protein P8P83_02070 [Rickettsiaceae bacterium]|nr:hypothetical protein [Rickettsiaceae bacterium]